MPAAVYERVPTSTWKLLMCDSLKLVMQMTATATPSCTPNTHFVSTYCTIAFKHNMSKYRPQLQRC